MAEIVGIGRETKKWSDLDSAQEYDGPCQSGVGDRQAHLDAVINREGVATYVN